MMRLILPRGATFQGRIGLTRSYQTAAGRNLHIANRSEVSHSHPTRCGQLSGRELNLERVSYGVIGFTATAGLLFRERARRIARCEARIAPMKQTVAQVEVEKQEPGITTRTMSKIKRLCRRLVNFCLLLFRTGQLLVIFLPPIVASPLLLLEGQTRHWWRMCLVFSLQHGGPAFQKLGQWASTRPDLFGAETRADLEHFHSDVPAEFWHKTQRTLTEAGLSTILDSIEKKPVGAGCIAQVHRARMNGQEVAVKIRRRGVRERIIRDTDLLCAISYYVEKFLPFLRVFEIHEVALNISGFLKSQLDLREEGKNLTKFAEIFREGPLSSQVTFPVPLRSTETVLIETFEHGVLLSKLLALDHKRPLNAQLRKQMAQAGVKSFLEMVIVQNFCHADAHPGNIMIRTNPPFDLNHPEKEYTFDKLVYVDAGLVNTLKPQDQVNFVDLFQAVAEGDGERAANLMIDRSRDPLSCIDRPGFVQGMSEIIDQVQLDSFRLDRVRIGTVLERVMTLVHRHHVRLEPNFTSLIVSIIVLEGVGRQLDPELDIFRTSVPMLLRAEKMYKKAALEAVYEAVTQKRRNSRKSGG